ELFTVRRAGLGEGAFQPREPHARRVRAAPGLRADETDAGTSLRDESAGGDERGQLDVEARQRPLLRAVPLAPRPYPRLAAARRARVEIDGHRAEDRAVGVAPVLALDRAPLTLEVAEGLPDEHGHARRLGRAHDVARELREVGHVELGDDELHRPRAPRP